MHLLNVALEFRTKMHLTSALDLNNKDTEASKVENCFLQLKLFE